MARAAVRHRRTERRWRKPASNARAKIREMVRRIVERFHPDKIILFGSYARGTAGPDSDADLLVVMSVSRSKRQQAVEIDVAVAGIGLPRT